MEKLAIKLCMTKDIGIHGNLFGGIMLAWLDEAAATWACSLCQNAHMVTAKIDEMMFEKPVKAGNQVIIYGSVKRLGTTSITLYIEARSKDFYTREEELVCSTYFIFVRIGDHGHPVPIKEDIRQELSKQIEA